MAERAAKSRIKFAYYDRFWDSKTGNRKVLEDRAEKVPPAGYEAHMDGFLYCPGCFTPLSRTPKDKQIFSNGRLACYAHLPSNQHVLCDLKSAKPEGKKFDSEELAKQAIAQEELVLVSGFLKDPPDSRGLVVGTYDQSHVEDVDGPSADVPISRHHGGVFRLPTKLSTVQSICRRFDLNLYRHYHFPGASAAVRLIDALVDVATVEAEDDTPRLYFGEIIRSFNPGRPPRSTNTRMTKLRCHPNIRDFYLKDQDSAQSSKGIGDESVGRVVIFWGEVTSSGLGLCVQRLGWGEYALLPDQYKPLLLN